MKSNKLIPVPPGGNSVREIPLSNDIILQQMERVIAHRFFAGSPILRRFLVFVVHETLAGNANKIKEYTIAVHVLNKPAQFETHNNGVVRVHASRLRRSLNNYYRSSPGNHGLIISIPKGQYIPVFQPAGSMISDTHNHLRPVRPDRGSDKPVLAILPFRTFEKICSRIEFSEGIGHRLSIELNKTADFSILSHDAIRELTNKQIKIHHLATRLNAQYVLSGNVYFEGRSVRIFVKLIDTAPQTEVWSDIFSYSSYSSYFKLSDLITSDITSSLRLFISGNVPFVFCEYEPSNLSISGKA